MGRLLCILFQLLTLHITLNQSQQWDKITVYILPTAGTTIYVNCWSNNTQQFSDAKSFTNYSGEFSWMACTQNYYCTPYDAFWCRARMGSNILLQFPVYGGGVERNSSEWVINSRGKRRLSLNSKFAGDHRGEWLLT